MEPLTEGEPDFSDLQRYLTERLQVEGYSRFSDFGNRHGSWEITFAKQLSEMTLFVSVDLTPSSPPTIGQLTTYGLEVWVGADNGDRFCRRMIGQLSLTEQQANNWQGQQSMQSLLKDAVEFGDRLRVVDLDGAYSRSFVDKR